MSAMTMSAPIRAAVTASSTFSTSTSTFTAKDLLESFSMQARTPPHALMWLSLTMIMESRPILWGSPPAILTASFSKSPNPGVVFLVAATTIFPSALATAAEVAVATPDILIRMFRAVRSMVIMDLIGPERERTLVPAATLSPSLTRGVTDTPADSNRSSTIEIPATVQSPSQTMLAVPSVSGTVSSVVMSPRPMSALRNLSASMLTRPARTPRRSSAGARCSR